MMSNTLQLQHARAIAREFLDEQASPFNSASDALSRAVDAVMTTREAAESAKLDAALKQYLPFDAARETHEAMWTAAMARVVAYQESSYRFGLSVGLELARLVAGDGASSAPKTRGAGRRGRK